ncbi:MAG: DUF1080 domain-containing protein [Verrucomicrobiaceae bacterium]|nr:DUF1080 domain-containing protein [Verrucomicrobiaceae bacterium]
MKLAPVLLLAAFAGLAHAQQPKAPKPPPAKAFLDAKEAGPDFAIQGEYAGKMDGENVAVQVWSKGGEQFEAVGFTGGLPGAGWDGDRDSQEREQGSRDSDGMLVTFRHDRDQAVADGVTLTVTAEGKKAVLQKVTRSSPTLGAVPPEGAVVLFDGKGVNRFPNSRVDEKLGALEQGITSEDTFGDCTVHVEFMLPFMPDARGQGRGNSGLYLQGRYEVQMLDSFALEGKDNECGGLYKIAAPKVNMCLPPLTWQTYDVDFTAANYDAEGKKTANAKITVKHNGVVIHENQELPGSTAAAPKKEENTPGPIYLQNHGNPVRYRNIWVVRK